MPNSKPQSVPTHWLGIAPTTQVTSPGGPHDPDYPGQPQYWIITQDLLSDDGEVPRKGWHNIPADVRELDRSKWIPFWLADDDGELYYGGWTNMAAFAPLDFARADAGCTTMWWWDADKGTWEML